MSVDTPASDRELVLTRLIDAPREKAVSPWTEPEVLKQWFTPAPYTTPVAELDVRPGGANLIVMRDPEGNEFPAEGSIWRPSKTSAWFYRCVHRGLATLAKAVHDRDRDLRE